MVGWAAGWTRGGVLAGCTALKNAGTKAGIAALKGRSTAAAASGAHQLVRAATELSGAKMLEEKIYDTVAIGRFDTCAPAGHLRHLAIPLGAR